MKQTLDETKCEKFGARVYQYGDCIFVKQTVLKGFPPEYSIDGNRERQVPVGDDQKLSDAIRDALQGKLKK